MQVEDCPDSSSDNDSSERLKALRARFDQSPTEAETAAADTIDRLHAVQAKIEEWRKKATPTATDFKHQEDALGQLQVEERILATAVKNLRGDFAEAGDASVPPRRTGVVNRAWIEATKLVGRNFTESEIEGGWPEALEPHRLACLQYPTDHVGQSYLNTAAIAACKNGELSCAAFEHIDHFLIQGGKKQVDVWKDYLIKADDFAGWWLAKGEEPSAHIAAWLSACGLPTGHVEKTAPAAIDEARSTGKQEERAVRTPKAWTPERIEEAQAMKARFKSQGVKDFEARTAAHYDVTPARLRAVLASSKTAQTKKSRSTWHSGLGK